MRTLDEIRNTPVLLLTDDEIAQLDPEGQEFARRCRARRAREDACPGHEPVATAPSSRSGWHPMRCKHCDKDMGVDSSG